jgi:histidinol-phosphate aminotransferase
MSTLLRPEIDSLAEYHLVIEPYRVKLNQNENPYELPEEVKREVCDRLLAARWSRYPAFIPEEEIAKVARFAGWVPEGTLLGNGSNELLQLLFTCALERGRSVVISQPTFTLYKILARGLGADVRDVPMLPGFRFDVDGILKAGWEASLVVLCSPNNPTGSVLTREEVCRVVEGTRGIVILDEAYVQFAPESQVELLARYDRLVILQTFSKAMGAAGLRFGYALGDPSLMKRCARLKLPYNVNIFTLMAAETFIDRWESIRWWIGKLKEEREALRVRLSEFRELRVHPSGGNFLLVETLSRTPKEVFRGLADWGILIRDVSAYPGLERGLRITVGRPEENAELISALKEVL